MEYGNKKGRLRRRGSEKIGLSLTKKRGAERDTSGFSVRRHTGIRRPPRREIHVVEGGCGWEARLIGNGGAGYSTECLMKA